MSESTSRHATIVVQRSRRWGHDRAYVRFGDIVFGYRDLRTGDVHCERTHNHDLVASRTFELYEQVRHEVTGYQARHGRSGIGVHSVADIEESFHGAHSWLVDGLKPVVADERFSRLGDGWHVVHSVPIGNRGGHVDHIAIGPPGVFAISDRAHPQTSVWIRQDVFRVNGVDFNYVRNIRQEAQRAATLLSASVGFKVAVRGVIAVFGAERGYTVRAQPHDVVVRKAKDLPRWLTRQPRALDSRKVEVLLTATRRSSTWLTQNRWLEPPV